MCRDGLDVPVRRRWPEMRSSRWTTEACATPRPSASAITWTPPTRSSGPGRESHHRRAVERVDEPVDRVVRPHTEEARGHVVDDALDRFEPPGQEPRRPPRPSRGRVDLDVASRSRTRAAAWILRPVTTTTGRAASGPSKDAVLGGEGEPDERDGEDDGECHQDQRGALTRFAPEPADPLPGGIGDVGSLEGAHAFALPGIDRDHARGSRMGTHSTPPGRASLPGSSDACQARNAPPKNLGRSGGLDEFAGGYSARSGPA
jgi:hypothetical protein